MEFVDRLEALRARNKDLSTRLKRLGVGLERLNGCSRGEREDEAEARRDPAEIVTLTDGDRGPARNALSKAIVRFAGNETVILQQARDKSSDIKLAKRYVCCFTGQKNVTSQIRI